MAALTKEKSISVLRKRLDRLREIIATPIVNLPDAQKWVRDTRLAVVNVFGEMSTQLSELDKQLESYTNEEDRYATLKVGYLKLDGLNIMGLLESMIEEIEDFWPDDPRPGVGGAGLVRTQAGDSHRALDEPVTKDIFIIHGHDHGAKEEVARFLSKIGLNPIILHELPNRGRAVIEKFEKHATASYAVALLTPDDVGAAKTEADKLQPRPRQNVLFEFGYFIGNLGRERVCGLVKGAIEIPSDYAGVLLIPLDSAGAWRLELLRELRDAKLPIDVNSAL
ncbi:MAG TPA: nucleotide-binding protein [Pyrinomonadaceae bacterium]|jgi:hypothetical protein